MEDWRIKVSVLWLFGTLTALTTMLLMLLEPGVIEQIIGGQLEGQKIGPEVLLAIAVLVLIPLSMTFLTLVLKHSTNRWTNIVLGIVYASTGLKDLLNYAARSQAYAVLLNLSGTAASALIVWYAWKSKKPE